MVGLREAIVGRARLQAAAGWGLNSGRAARRIRRMIPSLIGISIAVVTVEVGRARLVAAE